MATATKPRSTRPAQPTGGSWSSSIAHSEEQFNQVADHLAKNGFLTDKQVEYARRVQSKLEQSRPLLQVIKELKYITDDEIGQALRKHPVSIRIGELLVELGHISVCELKSALGIQVE
jgi:type IV pilus assembly protein PilB